MKTTAKFQNHQTRDHEQYVDLDTLIRRAAGGDRKSLAILARQLRPQLLAEARRACRKRRGRMHDAEDVVQELFLFLLSGEARTLPQPERGVAWAAQVIEYLAARRANARTREAERIREEMERRE
jgi:DNA-directed RNA polymerase specialized sigma24 family protein